MFRSKVLPFVLTAVLVAPAACGDDKDDDNGGTGPSGDQLTTVEFESMVEALSAINSEVLGAFGAFDQASSPALAAQTGNTFTYSETESCPNGGTTGTAGTITISSAGESATGNVTVTTTFNNCQAQSTNGSIWTFNGNPNIAMNLNFTSSQDGSFSMTGTYTGGFTWGGSGKGGGCAINTNLNYTGTVSGQSYAYNYTQTGTVCGQAVNETWSFTS
jgi:hypothetical protein